MAEPMNRVHALPGDAADDDFDLPDLCARPQCRKEFRQNLGRGRKANYCSETCRRLADRDYKRARATVEQFERLARRSRYDVLAFGRSADELGESESPSWSCGPPWMRWVGRRRCSASLVVTLINASWTNSSHSAMASSPW